MLETYDTLSSPTNKGTILDMRKDINVARGGLVLQASQGLTAIRHCLLRFIKIPLGGVKGQICVRSNRPVTPRIGVSLQKGLEG